VQLARASPELCAGALAARMTASHSGAMNSSDRFSRADLDAAVLAGVIDSTSAQRLQGFLAGRAPASPPLAENSAAPATRFDLIHLLWYAGALIIMSAMGLFSTLAFSAMGSAGLAATGIAYGLGLWFMGDRLWRKDDTRTPGGLLVAAAVAMVPLVVFALQDATGSWAGFEKPGQYRNFFHYIQGGWIPMEIATLAAALLAARRYAFAFIAFPAAFSLWFLSMDLAIWITGSELFSFQIRRKVSLWFGIALFVLTCAYEMRPRRSDFAFWLHIVAAITFWGGLTFQSSNSDLAKFLYCLINVALLAVAVWSGRRVYAALGVIGVMVYLSDLAYRVFKDSLIFPFALSAFGLLVVALGIYLARRQSVIAAWLEANLPAPLLALRPYPARTGRTAAG